MKGQMHLIFPDLAELLAPSKEGTWNMLADLDQYMRMRAEFQAWLAERGESE